MLDATKRGEPIPVRPDGWTGHNMLTLAGILSAAVLSQGPQNRQALGLNPEMVANLHPETKEAIDDTLTKDIRAVTEFLGMLTFGVIDGNYDGAFEPEVKGVVYRKDGGDKATIIPLQGFKRV